MVPALGAGLLAAAAAIIVVRLAAPELADTVPLFIAAGALVAIPFGLLALRRRESPAMLAGHLDRLTGADGLVMALASQQPDRRDAAWTERTSAQLAQVQWPRRRRPDLGLLLVGLLSLAVAIWLPQREAHSEPLRPWETHFQRAEHKLETLASDGLLPDAKKDELEKQLAKLRDQAGQMGMTQPGWEGLDRLDKSLDDLARLSAQRLAEAIVAAKTADEPRKGDPPPEAKPREDDPETEEGRRRPRDRNRLKPKEPEAQPEQPESPEQTRDRQRRLLERLTREREQERLSELAKSLGRLGDQAPGLMPRLSEKGQQALEKMLEQLAKEGQLDEETLRKLAESGMLGEDGQPGEDGGEDGQDRSPSPEELEEALEELEKALEEGRVKLGKSGAGGQMEELILRLQAGARAGGTSRGPGHVALGRDKDAPVPEVGGAERLPQGSKVNGDGSIALGTSERAPEVDEATLRELVRAQTRAFGASDADARRAGIAPRHRRAVGRYFEKGAE